MSINKVKKPKSTSQDLIDSTIKNNTTKHPPKALTKAKNKPMIEMSITHLL